jgi:hypothetical protein
LTTVWSTNTTADPRMQAMSVRRRARSSTIGQTVTSSARSPIRPPYRGSTCQDAGFGDRTTKFQSCGSSTPAWRARS